MMHQLSKTCAILIKLSLLSVLCSCAATQAPSQTSASVTYQDLAPTFSARCTLCHNGDFAPLGLHLTSYDEIMKGSTNGPVVISGNPAGSELIKRLKGQKLPQMPRNGPPFLTEEEITKFESWIAGGLKKE